jgi:hypothetical protein
VAQSSRGLVINLNAYGATVRLEGGELAIAPETDVQTHRTAYQRSLVRRKEMDFEVRRDGRRITVLLAPQIRDDELDDRIAEYLKSTQEWEDPEGPPAHERHFLSKKRRAELFTSKQSDV